MVGGFGAVGRGELAIGDGEPDAVGLEVVGAGLDSGPGEVGAGPALVGLCCDCAPGFPEEPAHPAVTESSTVAAVRIAAAARMARLAFTIRL